MCGADAAYKTRREYNRRHEKPSAGSALAERKFVTEYLRKVVSVSEG
jgi:hypothetical protein